MSVLLRPLLPGELSEPRDPQSEFDDYGPKAGYATPPPCEVDAAGTLAIVVDDALVGSVGWHWQQWGPSAASRSPMIGIWLQKSARGKGVGTQAQRLVADLLFRHTQVNRVEAHTDVRNVAEQRALERAGFSQEGVVRGAHWRNGRHHDGFLYSVLRDEWANSQAGAASV
ncbi:GNAT family N-acetyltransferase [Luteipulveratus mongoliensis]|uniref:GNAT family N-acetyltransferase n=1 Tax=Luteipulveratus mongoliensis TaxID=571913 RepID=UPI000697E1BA|nr:GNAT family protein [Luteipulveratus mongoliensis]